MILVDGAVDEDELVLAAADAGADDVEADESSYACFTAPEEPPRRAGSARGGGGLAIESAEFDDGAEDGSLRSRTRPRPGRSSG